VSSRTSELIDVFQLTLCPTYAIRRLVPGSRSMRSIPSRRYSSRSVSLLLLLEQRLISMLIASLLSFSVSILLHVARTQKAITSVSQLGWSSFLPLPFSSRG
jgi:hypothetical protein